MQRRAQRRGLQRASPAGWGCPCAFPKRGGSAAASAARPAPSCPGALCKQAGGTGGCQRQGGGCICAMPVRRRTAGCDAERSWPPVGESSWAVGSYEHLARRAKCKGFMLLGAYAGLCWRWGWEGCSCIRLPRGCYTCLAGTGCWGVSGAQDGFGACQALVGAVRVSLRWVARKHPVGDLTPSGPDPARGAGPGEAATSGFSRHWGGGRGWRQMGL